MFCLLEVVLVLFCQIIHRIVSHRAGSFIGIMKEHTRRHCNIIVLYCTVLYNTIILSCTEQICSDFPPNSLSFLPDSIFIYSFIFIYSVPYDMLDTEHHRPPYIHSYIQYSTRLIIWCTTLCTLIRHIVHDLICIHSRVNRCCRRLFIVPFLIKVCISLHKNLTIHMYSILILNDLQWWWCRSILHVSNSILSSKILSPLILPIGLICAALPVASFNLA